MKRYLIAALLITIAAAAYGYIRLTEAPAPLMATEPMRIHQGAIVGGIDPKNPDILQFNGIPYAKATRWMAPEPAPQWGAEIKDAREFGPECLQPRGGMSAFVNDVMKGQGLSWPKRQMASFYLNSQPSPKEREDCLFLNVRTANMNGVVPKPVMVWIHGGSHQSGSGSAMFYQANGLTENGVVLVTINYRLGPFGYLAHPALTEEGNASGNYGLMDQIAALRWVKENISQFGGDPYNVTIFGESAGAQSVSEIMAAPSSKGLFHKAILQSGASSYNAVHLRDTPIEGVRSAEDVGTEFLEKFVGPASTATDLRNVPAAEIIRRAEAKPGLTGYFKPIVDGHILPQMIGQSLRDGPAARVPILAGYNADEATLFYPSMQTPSRLMPEPMVGTLEDRQAELAKVFGQNRAKALEALYGMDKADTWHEGATQMLGDDMFGVHMRMLGSANADAEQPTWLYFFTRVPPSRNQTIGAYHAAEIPFVFDSHLSISPPSDEDRAITKAMGKYWTNFARTGDPNGDGLEIWPAFSRDHAAWMRFGTSARAELDVRRQKLDILEEVFNERIDQVAAKIGPFPDAEVDEDAVIEGAGVPATITLAPVVPVAPETPEPIVSVETVVAPDPQPSEEPVFFTQDTPVAIETVPEDEPVFTIQNAIDPIGASEEPVTTPDLDETSVIPNATFEPLP